jgi:hypothetical protein
MAHQFQKIGQYNEHMRKSGRQKEVLPRVLCLVDEFQVMFNELDTRSLERIKTQLTAVAKLGRAMGVHMWFTSQSMEGTLKKDTLDQFKLRMCLRGSRETATEILGNDAPTKIKTKGWVYSNDSGGQDPSSNRLFRVPLLEGDGIKSYLRKLIDKCAKEGRIHRQARFYDEDQIHPGSDIAEVYNTNPIMKEQNGLFIMGERTMYTEDKTPYTVTLKVDDAQHLFLSAPRRNEQANLALTIIENCKQRGVSYIVNSADKELLKLTGVEGSTPEELKPLLNMQMGLDELLNVFESIVASAEEDGDTTEMHIILLAWDKLERIGRNPDHRVEQKIMSILRRSSQRNIHFHFVVRETADMRSSVMRNCDHRVVTRCSERESGVVVETDKAAKLPKGIGMHFYDNNTFKFKVYKFVEDEESIF